MTPMAATSVTLSELVQHPTEVISHLNDGDVFVTRRQAETLRLSLAVTDENHDEAMRAIAVLIRDSFDAEEASKIEHRLMAAFPWLDFIPHAYRGDFVREFLRSLLACSDVGRYGPLNVVIESWKETARAYAEGITPSGAYLERPSAVPRPHS